MFVIMTVTAVGPLYYSEDSLSFGLIGDATIFSSSVVDDAVATLKAENPNDVVIEKVPVNLTFSNVE